MTPLITEHSIMAQEAHTIAEEVVNKMRRQRTELFHQTLESAYMSIRKAANNGEFETTVIVPDKISDMHGELMSEFSSRNYGVKAQDASGDNYIELEISW